jgi:uncharacterized membrane protein
MELRRNRRMVFGLLAVAPLGFLDATYLSVEHFLNKVPPCSITHGCEAVTTSPYALVFGIPMAVLGAVYYLAIILGLVYYLDSRKSAVLKAVSGFTAFGFLFSLYLVYLQLFVIRAICQYCMLSALSSTLLFIIGAMVLKSHRSFDRQPA